ncbi:putative Lipoprotein [Pseudomonas syringae pv. helianthi]|uniref:Putative Lipoprotein n=2 Tax=Pseudomonas syringae group TaxID=136849 RepID=A0A0P9LWH9_9PSED|nr:MULTISPECIES: DUF4136 domain-containing protein [Pseudomonas syringae group]KAA8695425.1 DUF4136 domain-containing protein [Pseudomonas caricapapayae]KPW59329.1 putative Lipoprotein [Pseudomonas caricapapayae]RMM08229.1 hypothetical protein ALQ84_200065 [Pseudomonas caricapapayae]RMV50236.1 putative Lipoprotein [Pseudomonas syringae pv. helianthi]RMV69204.1 putative Lipoprotein [Pseudomonas caricapapayae]
MFRRIVLLSCSLLLAACQSNSINRDFDAQRDFGGYRNWSWKEPAVQYQPDNDPRLKSDLTEQRIRQSISEQLDQRGLRMAAAGARPDVKVQAWLIVENRQQTVSTNYGGGWNPWGGYGYWNGPMSTETRSVDYKVGTLQIDMFDGKDGKLVWRGSTERILNDNAGNPTEREQAIRTTVAKILEQYPPR